jgi:flavin-dependent dehydrogenase
MQCDVLVVGAGPAGLGAAISSSKKGLKTILVEKSSEIGYPAKSSGLTWKKVVDYRNLPGRVISQWTSSKAGLIPPNRNVELGIGFEYEKLNYKVRNPNAIDFYVGEEEVIPIGYGWVLPTGEDRAKVGVATV